MFSVNEPKTNSDSSDCILKVYPNPAVDILNINYEFPFDENSDLSLKSIKIVDSYGKTIKEIKIKNQEASVKLNTTNYVKGIYYIGLYDDNLILKSKQFIIN